jgi:hypothetical protein
MPVARLTAIAATIGRSPPPPAAETIASEQRRPEPDQEGGARPVDHPRQQIASERVGAEQVDAIRTAESPVEKDAAVGVRHGGPQQLDRRRRGAPAQRRQVVRREQGADEWQIGQCRGAQPAVDACQERLIVGDKRSEQADGAERRQQEERRPDGTPRGSRGAFRHRRATR